MKNILQTPKTSFKTIHNREKFEFAWHIILFYMFASFAFSVFSFFAEPTFFPYFLIAFFCSILCFYVTRRYPNYFKGVINFLLLVICFLVYLSVIGIKTDMHYIGIIWLLIVILTAFFIVGNKWGLFYLVISTVLYALYFTVFFINEEEFQHILTNGSLFISAVEFGVGMLLIAYIMYRYGRLNKLISEKYKDAFQQIQEEKEVIEQKNKEATALLQEIHHRVKNNLQVIISLLRIQSNSLTSKEAKGGFKDAIERIMAMSLVHQKMYEKESLANINLKEYIETLLGDLIKTKVIEKDIAYKVSTHLKELSVDRLIPLGLIINELVTNSIKYAFNENGKIGVEIVPLTQKKFKMTYFDNGTWKENTKKDSLGLQLIATFAEQLDGSFQREVKKEGTFYYFILNEK